MSPPHKGIRLRVPPGRLRLAGLFFERHGVGGEGLRPEIDFDAICRALLSQAETLVPQWLPNGRRRGHEWVCGDLSGAEGSSCSVNLRTGAWADFSGDDRGGDLLSLYAAKHGISQSAAARELMPMLGMVAHDGAPAPARQAVVVQPPAPARPEPEWTAVHPVPDEAPDYRKHWGHYARGVPKLHWAYFDQQQRLLGVVCRFEASDGSKDVQPLSWCVSASGKAEWRYKAFAEPRPLYGLDRLPEAAHQATAPAERPLVILVEGEKCADALYVALDTGMPVLSWPGGAKAVRKVDFSPLRHCRVLTWADADAKTDKASGALLPLKDQPGMAAMLAAETALKALGVPVRHVDIGAPGERPDGWDCADAVEEGWDRAQILAFIARLLPQPQPTAPAPAPAGGGLPPSGAGAGTEDSGAGDESWRDRLIWANKWKLQACTPNVIEVLAHHRAWADVIGFDDFAQRVVKRRPAPYDKPGVRLQSDEWSDVDDTRAAAWIAQNEHFVPQSSSVAEAVNVVARLNTFHPVRDWLETLKWDGIPRVNHWLVDFLAVEDTDYARKVGRYFLIGMVMRVLQPGVKFDYCLVLEGKQGKRKSTALRILGGQWFSDTELDLSNKDSMSAIRGKWLHEFGEMGSIARAESTRQKSFLSRQIDEFRPSYGRREIRCPRQSAFAGTTNEWQWNKDPTGGRRFWPVEVTDDINTVGLEAVREQLFAEAMVLASSGERYWPDGEEQRELFDDQQMAREAPEAYVEILASWLRDRSWEGETFTLSDAIMSGLKIDAKSISRDVQSRAGIALAKLECERVERRNAVPRFVYRRPRRNAASSEPRGVAETGVEIGVEVPF